MNKLLLTFAFLCCALGLQAQGTRTVMAYPDGSLGTPTNLMWKNLTGGTNIYIERYGTNGALRINTVTNTGGGSGTGPWTISLAGSAVSHTVTNLNLYAGSNIWLTITNAAISNTAHLKINADLLPWFFSLSNTIVGASNGLRTDMTNTVVVGAGAGCDIGISIDGSGNITYWVTNTVSGGVVSNLNTTQFALGGTTNSIKDGARVTNLNHQGTITLDGAGLIANSGGNISLSGLYIAGGAVNDVLMNNGSDVASWTSTNFFTLMSSNIARAATNSPMVTNWTMAVHLFDGNQFWTSGAPAVVNLRHEARLTNAQAFGLTLYTNALPYRSNFFTLAGETNPVLLIWTDNLSNKYNLSSHAAAISNLVATSLALPTGANSNWIWVCTNSTTGYGQWRSIAGISGVALSNLVDVSISTNNTDGNPLTWNLSIAKWTNGNLIVVSNATTTSLTVNGPVSYGWRSVTIGSTTNAIVDLTTNAYQAYIVDRSFGLNFVGTPATGQAVTIEVTNTTASPINASNFVAGVPVGMYDYGTVSTGVLAWAVAPYSRALAGYVWNGSEWSFIASGNTNNWSALPTNLLTQSWGTNLPSLLITNFVLLNTTNLGSGTAFDLGGPSIGLRVDNEDWELTFVGTPTTNQEWSLYVSNYHATDPFTLTIPTSYSMNWGTNITSLVCPAASYTALFWKRIGTNNVLFHGGKIDESNLQASSMVLSNIVGTGALTNASAYQASSMVLSNIVGSGALTNPSAYQASSMVLSNIVGTGALTNSESYVASSSGLATNLTVSGLNIGTNSQFLITQTESNRLSIQLPWVTNALTVLTNGNVGIGTSAPEAVLHVSGQTYTNSLFKVHHNGDVLISLETNGQLRLVSAGVPTGPLFKIAGTGNFTGSPTDLDEGIGFGMVYNTAYNRQFWIGDSSGGSGIRIVENRINGWNYISKVDLDLALGTYNKIVYVPESNVAIGTNAPGARLDVTGDGSSPYLFKAGLGMLGGKLIDTNLFSIDTNGTVKITPTVDSNLKGANILEVKNTNGTVALCVASNGNVGVGTGTPSTAMYIVGSSPTFYIERSAGYPSAFSITFPNGDPTLQSLTASKKLILNGYNVSDSLVIAPSTGLVGIGTNAPAARLHVTGDNATDLVLQAGTTNRPTLLTMNTNGHTAVYTLAGAPVPQGAFGSVTLTNNLWPPVGIMTTATYTNAEGWTFQSATNLFYVEAASGSLIPTYSGWYRISISLSALGAANQVIEGCVLTNMVDPERIGFKKQYSTSQPRLDSHAASGIMFINAGHKVSFGLKSDLTNALTISKAEFAIGL